MNTQESCTILCPNDKTEECAKLVIDDLNSVFVIADVMTVGSEYTFSCWIRSDAAGSVIVHGEPVSSTTEWTRVVHTFVASGIDLMLLFTTVGNYYIYNAQLELGNIATDWTAAPEDTEASIEDIKDSVSELTVGADEIRASVSTVSNDLEATKTELSELAMTSTEISLRVGEINNELQGTQDALAELKLTSDSFTVAINKINEEGVDKVSTTTGVFDDAGLTIDKSDSLTKTQITPDGMLVYAKDNVDGDEKVLEATSAGVDAKNLHAKTYLTIGGRSRFENYGSDRTGCFWIGG